MCGAEAPLRYPGTVTPKDHFSRDGYSIARGNTKETLDIYECASCGFGFSLTGLREEELTAYYARQPEDLAYLAEAEGRRKTFFRTLSRIERLLGKRGRIFDFGAGPGVFLDEARKAGWEVSGAEAASWARAYAKKEYGITLVSPIEFADEIASGSKSRAYDVVTLFDVIEHVHDPATLVNNAASLLKPGGVLLITTPRFESLTRKMLGRRWYFLFPAHIWYFTKSSLTKLFERHSLTPVSWRWHVFHFSLGYLFTRLGLKLPNVIQRALSHIEILFCLGEEWEVYARLTRTGASNTL
jgi:SAM-dependent methyltransferase